MYAQGLERRLHVVNGASTEIATGGLKRFEEATSDTFVRPPRVRRTVNMRFQPDGQEVAVSLGRW